VKRAVLLSVVLLTALPCPGIRAGQDPARTIQLPGLKEPVEILRDRWGIAHIYAKNEHDLFFAQGYSAACDRLFQLELWRRHALGTCAEVFGRRELKADTASRLFRFRGDLSAELSLYHPRGESIVKAFVEGVNARIDEAEQNPDLLPLEFRLLGLRPGRWTPEVVISRHQGLLANATQELSNGRAVGRVGTEKVKELSWFRPGDPVLALDPAIEVGLLDENILELYEAFKGTLRFTSADLVATARRAEETPETVATYFPAESAFWRLGIDVGSNNWTVSGQRTLSGFPILANDPHRVIAVPSLRYWVHLVAPGWNVIGGGEPAIPGVSIGHNDVGAWGLTIFGQDTEDLYVYDTNPVKPDEYRYRGGWETMRILKETISVKGESPVAVDLKYTRHGPVLFEDRARHKAVALRPAWLETGCAPYLASLRTDQAASVEGFREACSYARIPALNWVWADRNKNIAYQAASISPIRRSWDGLVPVPGDGRYEWDGYLPIKDLPHVENPAKGYWGTANNYQVPDGYPFREAVHRSWGDEMRGSRLEELLSSSWRLTVADMMRMQHDELSLPARNLVPFLRNLECSDPAQQKARDLLIAWNHVLDRDSIPAAVYSAFERRLLTNLREPLIPRELQTILGPLNLKRVIDWVSAPDGRFGANPVAGRDALLARTLAEAVQDLTEKLGPDLSRWQYGQAKYKRVEIAHPLSAIVKPDIRKQLDFGPAPRGGSASTLNATGGEVQTVGASFRIIADTQNWDNSVGTNTPGQSGDSASPHYRDLFDLWARNQYFPAFFSRTKVESVTEERISLHPARR